MLMSILNVVYVLVAIAMIALILMQRGSGAAAGSGFGAGASGTVFGARGASNFLSKSTKWLAVVFFGISLFMAWYASHGFRPSDEGLGVMSQVQELPAAPASEVPAIPQAAEVGEVPQAAAAPADNEEKPAEGSHKD
ncbi:preprotein translocase subunit SecG [Stenotrophomonas mori]|uniref:Protein-export membrane protein SecG n=1 Tax=Stenotrophomonas mori TaxID=2871096 RepID=A0ABT0SFL4_9GAMM|nr:preprotein translocase subunit SecG [Stenotrophomonas mori]MCL7714121.1 preprotein translocase subunit SecG [Stenotrophomonas mori]